MKIPWRRGKTTTKDRCLCQKHLKTMRLCLVVRKNMNSSSQSSAESLRTMEARTVSHPRSIPSSSTTTSVFCKTCKVLKVSLQICRIWKSSFKSSVQNYASLKIWLSTEAKRVCKSSSWARGLLKSILMTRGMARLKTNISNWNKVVSLVRLESFLTRKGLHTQEHKITVSLKCYLSRTSTSFARITKHSKRYSKTRCKTTQIEEPYL